MSADGMVIARTGPDDMEDLSVFMAQQGQQRCSADYLRHWYFGRPGQSASVIVGRVDGRIVGMATTTDHVFTNGVGDRLVGMPQKVLTDASLRGRGIFGRLYRAAEEACRARGCRRFLTITNAASTPIFLGSFGYARLPVPRLAVLPALPGTMAPDAPQGPLPGIPVIDDGRWRMRKDAQHMRWRYTEHPGSDHFTLRVPGIGGEAGRVTLKRMRKAGLPVCVLLDLVPSSPGAWPDLLRAARHAAWRHRTVALLVLEGSWPAAWFDHAPWLSRSSGLNWLVKGEDEEDTRSLLQEVHLPAFGDLDFL